jgi:hypothetical protein
MYLYITGNHIILALSRILHVIAQKDRDLKCQENLGQT